ncbi:MAG: FAD-dependent oxidoreductase [Phycisphaerae bacterium]|jgi:NADPH-dependent glutamate synthase beta subunit-like oxidoreductase/NAD-dependent dihydropyrimidine dehydrogenase PreA subunit
MIKLTINDRAIETEAGKTVLDAALKAGIYIPNLCYHPDIPPIGSCRLCIVKIDGVPGFPIACTTQVKEGMVVHTDTEQIQELRKNIVWLILSEIGADVEKPSQLKKVIEWIGVKEVLRGYVPHSRNLPVVADEPLFVRDMNKCILCGRCVKICQEIRGVGAIGFVNRGINTIVGTGGDSSIKDAACKFCGACVEVCPTGALSDKESFEEKQREKKLLPCKDACPAHIDIPRYVRFIAEGRFQDAVEVIREKAPFPYVLGCVCTHPCEDACRRSEINEPVAIRALKRFVAEQDSNAWQKKVTIAPETGRKVAVVGSGPAGLTAAWFLRKQGHSVTVFEALPESGGMLRTGIPKYRLPEKVLNQEIKYIENIGVEIKTNTKIESLDRLFEQGFDAVFLALGAPMGMKMEIPGEDDPRVLDGISFLKSVNLGNKADITGKVAVIGGGNTAIDAARTVLRTGAEKVTILYRRTREEMPAAPEEIEDAISEGVTIDFLVAPQRVLPEKDKLKLECIKMKLGQPDASGRRRPVPVENSNFTIEADRIITAIGQKQAVPEKFDLGMNKWGYTLADEETLACSRKGVFSGGDMASGPASVIEAIEAGRKAAASIDKFLGGKGQIDQKFVPDETENPWLGRDEGFADKQRAEMPTLAVDKRVNDFSQVECGFDEKTSVEEARRCLRCQLRLKISKAPFPPTK